MFSLKLAYYFANLTEVYKKNPADFYFYHIEYIFYRCVLQVGTVKPV